MATSQNPGSSRRCRLGDRSATDAATPPGTDPTPDHPNEHSTGQPNARGTLPLAEPLADAADAKKNRSSRRCRSPAYPDLTDYIRQLVDEAPPLDDEQRARLGRILRPYVPRPRAALEQRDAAA